jgi:hypothetical protein
MYLRQNRNGPLLLFLLLGGTTNNFCFIRLARAQINYSIPGFSQIFNLGKGGDKEIQDKWWFWLIIGLIAALFIVIGFFTYRGVRRWRNHKKSLLGDNRNLSSTNKAEASDASLGPASVRSGERVVAVELAAMEKGGGIFFDKDGSSQRVTVEKREGSWAPKYGVNWEEVQRRAGPTPQQHQRYHHRRLKSDGKPSISDLPV